MTSADWRALIEAYLEGRLSAEAFARRFMEASRALRDQRAAVPRAIQELHVTVEEFAAESAERDEFATDDSGLIEAARRARAALDEDAPPAYRTFDRWRAQEEMRRFSINASGCAGLGCVFALIWVALCLLQIFAVSDQIQSVLDWPAAPATFAGLFIAFIPIVGNVIAFFGAVDVWGWDVWIAAVMFFAAPAATLLSGWSRWRRGRRSLDGR